MSGPKIRIATRSSNLALWQANFVAEQLRSAHPEQEIELVKVTTTGDQSTTSSLSTFGGVGVFTREIQNALLEDRADAAVHSLKDLPTQPVEGIALAAVPQRASPDDALVLPRGWTGSASIRELPAAARVGTGSQRRRAQLLHRRRDLRMLDVRGNVETRLRKLDEGEYDALVLAVAGLERLGLTERISARLAPPEMFPAAGQGALGIECRANDAAVRSILGLTNHRLSFAAVAAERRILNRLRAGCHAPVGVSTQVQGERLTAEAVVLSQDGVQRLYSTAFGALSDPEAVGDRIAEDLLRQGAGPLVNASPPQPVAEP